MMFGRLCRCLTNVESPLWEMMISNSTQQTWLITSDYYFLEWACNLHQKTINSTINTWAAWMQRQRLALLKESHFQQVGLWCVDILILFILTNIHDSQCLKPGRKIKNIKAPWDARYAFTLMYFTISIPSECNALLYSLRQTMEPCLNEELTSLIIPSYSGDFFFKLYVPKHP